MRAIHFLVTIMTAVVLLSGGVRRDLDDADDDRSDRAGGERADQRLARAVRY